MVNDPFIAHVRDSILHSETKDFEIETFPVGIELKEIETFLTLIYRTISSPKSSDDQKRVAVKILKQCLIRPKNKTLINSFLTCQLWEIFGNQFREYRTNPSSPKLSDLSPGYCMIIEDFFEGCKDELGYDANGKETPFLQLWNAATSSSNTNSTFSRLVILMTIMKAEDPGSLHAVAEELRRKDGGYEVGNFLSNFKASAPLVGKLEGSSQLSETEVFLLKAQFLNAIEDEFFFDFADPKALALLAEVVELESQTEEAKQRPATFADLLRISSADPLRRWIRTWNFAQQEKLQSILISKRAKNFGVSASFSKLDSQLLRQNTSVPPKIDPAARLHTDHSPLTLSREKNPPAGLAQLSFTPKEGRLPSVPQLPYSQDALISKELGSDAPDLHSKPALETLPNFTEQSWTMPAPVDQPELNFIRARDSLRTSRFPMIKQAVSQEKFRSSNIEHFAGVFLPSDPVTESPSPQILLSNALAFPQKPVLGNNEHANVFFETPDISPQPRTRFSSFAVKVNPPSSIPERDIFDRQSFGNNPSSSFPHQNIEIMSPPRKESPPTKPSVLTENANNPSKSVGKAQNSLHFRGESFGQGINHFRDTPSQPLVKEAVSQKYIPTPQNPPTEQNIQKSTQDNYSSSASQNLGVPKVIESANASLKSQGVSSVLNSYSESNSNVAQIGTTLQKSNTRPFQSNNQYANPSLATPYSSNPESANPRNFQASNPANTNQKMNSSFQNEFGSAPVARSDAFQKEKERKNIAQAPQMMKPSFSQSEQPQIHAPSIDQKTMSTDTAKLKSLSRFPTRDIPSNSPAKKLQLNPCKLKNFNLITSDTSKRLKVFAFMQKQKLISNTFLKVGIDTAFEPTRKRGTEAGPLKINCFWDPLTDDLQHVRLRVKNGTIEIPCVSTSNGVSFQLLEVLNPSSSPTIEISYTSRGNRYKDHSAISVPATKFLQSDPNSALNIEMFQSSRFPEVETSKYALHREFFKSVKDISIVMPFLKDTGNSGVLTGSCLVSEILGPLCLTIKTSQGIFMISAAFQSEDQRESVENVVAQLVFLFAHPHCFV